MISELPLRNRVKELRERIGLRQADLADAVGITRQTIIAIEKGRLNPSILISLKVARMLREPVDYVFFLAPGAEALSLANGTLGETGDKPAARKGKRGRPKGPRKPKEATPADEPDTAFEETLEDEGSLAEATGVESLEVMPEAEVLAPIVSEEVSASTYESFHESDPDVDEVRYELDRDSEAAIEEPQDEAENTVRFEEPQEAVVIEETSSADAFDASAPGPEEQDRQAQVRETKSGQAIWDFF